MELITTKYEVTYSLTDNTSEVDELPRMPQPKESSKTKRYPLVECGYGTVEEWTALARKYNTKAFVSIHGRHPIDAQELKTWVQSLQMA